MLRSLLAACALLVVLPAAAGEAAPLGSPVGSPYVPAPLRPWVPWVLAGHEEEACPALSGLGDARRCTWPAALSLDLQAQGGTFEQRFTTYADGPFALPGTAERWPLDVKVDGTPAAVVPHDDGGPAVFVRPGEHVVRGVFRWDELPEQLAVPAQTGLVSLVLAGKPIPFVDRDVLGTVWLQRRGAEEVAVEDRLVVTALRRVEDGAPLLVETRLLLEVSGKSREAVLDGALLAGFAPLSLHGSLPARLEPDGKLRVQVRPGTHDVVLTAVSAQSLPAIDAPKSSSFGAEEVWVYDARPAQRTAHVDGVVAVDPTQTRLPPEWQRLPAYKVEAGARFVLVEDRRGDAQPAPDQLHLRRALWLDFDGRGLTVHDDVTGSLSASDRLAMGPSTTLGRVSVDGADRFITRGEDGDGVELRQRAVTLSADARIDGEPSSIPAVSWRHDFQSVSARLHLPPGWQLLHASGVDTVETTWLKSWTLLDLFLLLVLSLAAARLWGRALGTVAFATFALTFKEQDAPMWIFVVVLAVEALTRALPEDKRPWRVARALRFCCAVFLALVALPFMVGQIRVGMYPTLEHPWSTFSPEDASRYDEGGGGFGGLALSKGAAAPMPQAAAPIELVADAVGSKLDEDREQDQVKKQPAQMKSRSSLSNDDDDGYAYTQRQLAAIDPNAVVQTGPGLPRWGWSSVELGYNGPVEADARISLVLIGPKVRFALALLRTLLLAVIVLAAFGLPGSFWPAALRRRRLALFALPLLVSLAPTSVRAAQDEAQAIPDDAAPSQSLLDELRRRVLAPAPCAPNCAAVARMSLSAQPASLRLRLQVDAAAATGVALPGSVGHWLPATVTVDGAPAGAALLHEDGQLRLLVAAGTHDVVLDGPLPRRDTVQIELGAVPHRVDVDVVGWTLDGVHEDGLADRSLQLSRQHQQGSAEKEGGDLEAGTLPPFLIVTRSLVLGLTWEVTTQVQRLSPIGAAVVVEVPLLPGESVTTEGVRSTGGKVQLNIAPSEQMVTWRSSLAVQPSLKLAAAVGAPWVEAWTLAASPVWHVQAQGVPPIHDDDDAGAVRTYRPWPGESATFTISRPTGVPGRTLTVDASGLVVRPGARSTEAVLTLDLRSSRGGQHPLQLPEGAQLLSLDVAGRALPVQQDGRVVKLPLQPGAVHASLVFRTQDGVSLTTTTPQVDIGAPSVNARIQVDVPADRWVLFATGPRAGPAVLFWSHLFVLLLASVALARVPGSPLRTHSWVLLGVGLTTVPVPAAAIVAGWLLVVAWRARTPDLTRGWFNLRQVALVCWTFTALGVLIGAIHEGLLGAPDMQVQGAGSSDSTLYWYADRALAALPRATVVSTPLLVYRALMLAWALWLALSTLRWLKQGWSGFGAGGMWRAAPARPAKVAPPPTTTTTTTTTTGVHMAGGDPTTPTSAAPMSAKTTTGEP